jgi:hypothetical protein
MLDTSEVGTLRFDVLGSRSRSGVPRIQAESVDELFHYRARNLLLNGQGIAGRAVE